MAIASGVALVLPVAVNPLMDGSEEIAGGRGVTAAMECCGSAPSRRGLRGRSVRRWCPQAQR
ncbi:hypothetical protein XAC3824_1450001 [Xanthomonas citri pv. citri]|nr:hypothetical protein XAC3824_1450001 [Xanthomonas citri pv. citri]